MLLENQAVYILHNRHFKDEDALLDCYSHREGRFRAVLPGLYRQNKNKAYQRGLLRPFTALSLTYKNNNGLKKITHVEAASAALPLQGHYLFSGLYLNELLLRLLPLEQAFQDVFVLYIHALGDLVLQKSLEPLLRQFELQLLSCLGLAVPLDICAGEAVCSDNLYCFSPSSGLRCAFVGDAQETLFYGRTLLALSQGNFEDKKDVLAAKRLMRQWLGYYLGDKPLMSRSLFLK